MKIENLYINKSSDSDNEIMSYLIEKYGKETIVDYLNESSYSYNGTRLDFDTTGGADLKGVKGLVKTIPGLALTTLISWPLTLLMGLGIINARIQQRWEKRNSWLQQIFNPNYWNEYYANINKDGSLLEQKMKSLGWFHDKKDNKIKDVSTGEEITLEKAESKLKNVEFGFYWVTLSNGEILRVRADNEEDVRLFVDKIIKDTKPVYRDLQERKGNANETVYAVYFDDGEYAIWVAPNEKMARKECGKIREDLATEMNKGFDKNTEPLKIISCRPKRTVDIEFPDEHNYKISKEMPKWAELGKKVSHIYEYNILHEFKIQLNNGYTIFFPAASVNQAQTFVQEAFSKTSPFIVNLTNVINKKATIYKVKFGDNDNYTICAHNEAAAITYAMQLHDEKDKIIKNVLGLKEFNIFRQIISDNPSYNKLQQSPDTVKVNTKLSYPKQVSLYMLNTMENKSEVIRQVPV